MTVEWVCINDHRNTMELPCIPRTMMLGTRCGESEVRVRCPVCGAGCKRNDFNEPMARVV